ncbi:MAG: FMN-binding protein [Tissierellia bacterium]|nr:FMN-binding protein [Tissierellia bacterium]
MKKLLVLALSLLLIVGCSKDVPETKVAELKDGTYTADSNPDEWGGKINVSLEVKDGKITACEIKNLDNEGKEKDEDYGKEDGKITNPGLYKIAQNAVESAQQYPQELIETQDIDQVEVISGATVSHQSFKEAVEKALEMAIE